MNLLNGQMLRRKIAEKGSISLNDCGCQSWQREGERIEDVLEVYSHSLSGGRSDG